MRRTTLLVAATLVALSASGCASPEAPAPAADDGPPAAGNQTLPAPKLLVSHNQTADDAATASSPYTADVTVDGGFDELLVGFAVSGTGTYNLRIVDAEGTEVVATGDEPVTGPPDSHATSPEPTAYNAVPGTYTATVGWTGAVTFTLELTERNHAWTHQFEDHDH